MPKTPDSKDNTLESKNLPDNRQEVNNLLNTVGILIKVFEHQRDETKSAATKKGTQSRIDELKMTEAGLNSLRYRFITTNSQDDLLAFCKSEEKLLQKFKSIDTNTGRIEKIQEEQDTLQATETFIMNERDHPSLEWGNRMLEMYKEKDKQHNQRQGTQQQKKDVDQADKLSENILIESIRESGRGMIHMSLPAEYSPRNNSGFQTLQDDGWYYRSEEDRSITDYMEKNKCPEVCKLGIIKKQEYITRVVAPEKKGILGFGKKEAETERIAGEIKIQKFSDFFPDSNNREDAYELLYYADCSGPSREGLEIEYQDYSGRRGQLLMMRIIIPASIAKKIGDKIKKDPKFIRVIAEDQMRKYFERNKKGSAFQKAWDNGDKATNEIPLRPPYEKWEKEMEKEKKGRTFSFLEEGRMTY